MSLMGTTGPTSWLAWFLKFGAVAGQTLEFNPAVPTDIISTEIYAVYALCIPVSYP